MSALPYETQLPDWKQALAARGILEAALDCGWAYKEERGVGGWSYPLQQYSGAKFPNITRWKAIDRTTAPQAYLWLGTKPETCQYYWAKGVKEALDDSWRVLYITAGEPDMLSMIAAGRRNVTTFFGEGLIPSTLLADLQRIEVSKVVYLTDMDNAGVEAAQKLVRALEGLIPCEVKKLPREFAGTTIKDVNDLWIACGFNKELFWQKLDDAPLWQFVGEVEVKPYYNYDAFAEAVEARLNVKKRKGNSWSENAPCIFHGGDEHPSAGYNFKTRTYFCFACGQSWNIEALAKEVGVDIEQFNENAGKTRPILNIVQASDIPLKSPKTPAPVTEVIRTSDESLTRYIERTQGMHIGEVTAAPFPFTVLHGLGGFCEILKPRKMVGVIGLSGGGKTSFLESMIDVLRQAGEFHTLWWGKEWRWDEMSDRAVQRQGGMTITQMARFELWQSETQNGGKARYGVRPPNELIELSQQLARDMQTWSGKVFYIDKPMPLDATLEYAQRKVDEKKAEGVPVRVAVWDYASLFDVKGARGELEKISNGLAMVKEFGELNELFTFVASQPRKDDAEQVKAGDKILSAEDAMYMNDHKFNLLLTLNPTYVEGIMQGWGTINVVKNSGGKLGKVAVQMDLPRLRWLDKPIGNGWESK